MKLYLIRHGRTVANETHLYCGSTDLPLSEKGIAELQQLHYNIPAGCRFLTSGMLRTEQTLYHLFGDVPHRIDSRFREVDFGVFEGKGYDELKEQPDYQAWISPDNEKNIPPGGESGEQMLQRVLEGLRELQKKQEDTVLITHGGVIAALMNHLFPEEEKNRYQWQPVPGSGYEIAQEGYRLLVCDGAENENNV
ncbi:MAG: histidine phosphatase family protein [Lachnospiraceae bacterium]|nr:histidine phosphatase family protein [Lachnospiraceae bacterium]